MGGIVWGNFHIDKNHIVYAPFFELRNFEVNISNQLLNFFCFLFACIYEFHVVKCSCSSTVFRKCAYVSVFAAVLLRTALPGHLPTEAVVLRGYTGHVPWEAD